MPFDPHPIPTKTPVQEVLLHALALLEKGWCQSGEAFDRHGNPVHAFSPRATQFCAVGAVRRACLEHSTMSVKEALTQLLPYVPGHETYHIINWNDSSTKAVVLDAFRKAVRRTVP